MLPVAEDLVETTRVTTAHTVDASYVESTPEEADGDLNLRLNDREVGRAWTTLGCGCCLGAASDRPGKAEARTLMSAPCALEAVDITDEAAVAAALDLTPERTRDTGDIATLFSEDS